MQNLDQRNIKRIINQKIQLQKYHMSKVQEIDVIISYLRYKYNLVAPSCKKTKMKKTKMITTQKPEIYLKNNIDENGDIHGTQAKEYGRLIRQHVKDIIQGKIGEFSLHDKKPMVNCGWIDIEFELLKELGLE